MLNIRHTFAVQLGNLGRSLNSRGMQIENDCVIIFGMDIVSKLLLQGAPADYVPGTVTGLEQNAAISLTWETHEHFLYSVYYGDRICRCSAATNER